MFDDSKHQRVEIIPLSYHFFDITHFPATSIFFQTYLLKLHRFISKTEFHLGITSRQNRTTRLDTVTDHLSSFEALVASHTLYCNFKRKRREVQIKLALK